LACPALVGLPGAHVEGLYGRAEFTLAIRLSVYVNVSLLEHVRCGSSTTSSSPSSYPAVTVASEIFVLGRECNSVNEPTTHIHIAGQLEKCNVVRESSAVAIVAMVTDDLAHRVGHGLPLVTRVLIVHAKDNPVRRGAGANTMSSSQKPTRGDENCTTAMIAPSWLEGRLPWPFPGGAHRTTAHDIWAAGCLRVGSAEGGDTEDQEHGKMHVCV